MKMLKLIQFVSDKCVLVIGASSSGTDVACDVAKVARRVLLSARCGVWIMPRLFTVSYDFFKSTEVFLRYHHALKSRKCNTRAHEIMKI